MALRNPSGSSTQGMWPTSGMTTTRASGISDSSSDGPRSPRVELAGQDERPRLDPRQQRAEIERRRDAFVEVRQRGNVVARARRSGPLDERLLLLAVAAEQERQPPEREQAELLLDRPAGSLAASGALRRRPRTADRSRARPESARRPRATRPKTERTSRRARAAARASDRSPRRPST